MRLFERFFFSQLTPSSEPDTDNPLHANRVNDIGGVRVYQLAPESDAPSAATGIQNFQERFGWFARYQLAPATSTASPGGSRGRRQSSTEAITEDRDIMDIAAIILLSGILED